MDSDEQTRDEQTRDDETRDDETRDRDGATVEQGDVGQQHDAGRDATPSEEGAADRSRAAMDDDERRRVAEHYEEMTDIGAHVQGEGAIE